LSNVDGIFYDADHEIKNQFSSLPARISMAKIKHVDYLIIGQGLAGSAIAVQLLKLRKKILVIDQPQSNTSSRIAAGLFNPITGRKMLKTWMADKLFPYLHQYYLGVEGLTGARFYYPMPLYRPFLSIEEQNEWMGKSVEVGYESTLKSIYGPRIFRVK
jgi:glycine/D-amino acid oxidase-like deaminating enzyme